MSYDNESTDMRIALWHEAGHAVAAMSMGLKIKSLGLLPMPHCLVDHRGTTKEEIGILLCAGAMMTSHVYNIEWGTETDYKMAESLGDLAHFKVKALELVTDNCSKARLIVDMLASGTDAGGENLVTMYGDKLFLADDHSLYYPESPCTILEKGSDEYMAIEKMVRETAPSGLMVKAIRFMAKLNIKYPKAMAVTAEFWAKLRA